MSAKTGTLVYSLAVYQNFQEVSVTFGASPR